MSSQLGETAGIGIAPDTLKLKAQAFHGCNMINASEQSIPRFLAISKGGGVSTAEDSTAQCAMLANGRVKKFGIYVKSATLTGDAELILRKNGADFGTSIIIPQAVGAQSTILSAEELDLEFVEGDLLNYQIRMVSGTGTILCSWSCHIEYDSDSDGEFQENIFVHLHTMPASLAVRRNMANHHNWISVDADQPAHPPLYSGRFKAVVSHVPTGFNQTTTHTGRAVRITAGIGNIELQNDFIVGETGTKIELGDGTETFSDSDLLQIQTGQSGGATLEPINTLIVTELDLPE